MFPLRPRPEGGRSKQTEGEGSSCKELTVSEALPIDDKHFTSFISGLFDFWCQCAFFRYNNLFNSVVISTSREFLNDDFVYQGGGGESYAMQSYAFLGG